MSTISFFSQDITFELPQPAKIITWIKAIIIAEAKTLNHLNYVFCSDSFLLKVNQEYLQHDYYTDIITFNSSEVSDIIEGDIFISIDRVLDNSRIYNHAFDLELNRVIVHGVLHLIGYDDSSDTSQRLMRHKEDSYLNLYYM